MTKNQNRHSSAIVLSLLIVSTLLAGCGRSASSDGISDIGTTSTQESSVTETLVSDGATGSDDRESDETYNLPPTDLEEAPASDFVYEYDADTQGIKIKKYTGTSIRVRIPDEIEGEPVTVIGKEAFLNGGMKYVYLPNSVTVISEYAFHNCEGLTEIIIPNSVKEIRGEENSVASGAFSGCSALSRIEIPGSVKELGKFTFYNCHGLKEVIIQNGTERIGGSAFAFCDNLIDVELPDSVTEIGSGAFQGCINLTTIDLPDSVTVIGNGSFSSSGLTAIHLPASLNMMGSSVFQNCTNLTGIEIPGSVKELDAWAFESCHGLKEVIIQNGVERIGDYAFQRCDNLVKVEIPDSVTEIDGGAFSGCISLTTIDLPDSITLIGTGSFTDSGLTAIHLPVSLKVIGIEAFRNCANLSDIESSCDLSSLDYADNMGMEIDLDGEKIYKKSKSGDYIFYGCPLSEEARQLIHAAWPDTEFNWLD